MQGLTRISNKMFKVYHFTQHAGSHSAASLYVALNYATALSNRFLDVVVPLPLPLSAILILVIGMRPCISPQWRSLGTDICF